MFGLLRSPAALPRLATPSRGFAKSVKGTRNGLRDVVLVDAVRTPFAVSGTHFVDLTSWDLGRMAVQGLLKRTAIDPSLIDRVTVGTVVSHSSTSNLAREVALASGIPNKVPAHTVTLACISSNVAMTTSVEQIQTGQAEICVAGGSESLSNVPIQFSRPIRKRLIASGKVKSPAGYVKLLSGLKGKDFIPEAPAIAEFSTNEVMGHSADRLAAKFGVSRADQDQLALRSHKGAAAAYEKGLLNDLLTVTPPPKFPVIDRDNGVRKESTIEKLSTLRPAFIKPHGTITAGNASFLTDGASAALMMSAEKAKELGYKPSVRIVDYVYCAQDPKEEMLLGPAYGMGRVLERNNLTLADIGVFEIHEAFACVPLVFSNALASADFCKSAGFKNTVGELDMDKVNTWGGSVSIGHPFGATGVRLVASAAMRLVAENQNLALISACAAGGQSSTILVERL